MRIGDGSSFRSITNRTPRAAFFLPFESAAILTVDGVGEWATTTVGVGEGEPHPPAPRDPLSALARPAVLRVHLLLRLPDQLGEYKLMGLAPYGTPRYAAVIRDQLIEVRDDGSFRLNLKFFRYCEGS